MDNIKNIIKEEIREVSKEKIEEHVKKVAADLVKTGNEKWNEENGSLDEYKKE